MNSEARAFVVRIRELAHRLDELVLPVPGEPDGRAKVAGPLLVEATALGKALDEYADDLEEFLATHTI